MNYENIYIHLYARDVGENAQTVNVSCNCYRKLETLEMETSQIRKMIQEQSRLLEGIASFIASDGFASFFESAESASVFESVRGEIP